MKQFELLQQAKVIHFQLEDCHIKALTELYPDFQRYLNLKFQYRTTLDTLIHKYGMSVTQVTEELQHFIWN